MDPAILIQLALGALGQVLALVAEIKSQSGMSDDQILAAAQKLTAGNDQSYTALAAALGAAPAPGAK